ncbi:cache domain-containing protein [Saccharopolyspora sp. WRP15-2]|uniref:Cache domain-containing protein n=1 Tax=Saccharopolyspora oryzae TaxID=2997343 RepID=A0ABT4UQQ7_9PSEU|nr:cache domain-containing protein [Saccharopolyspora oryzae]MDA3623989.1 cache domain-containing protein [Saccharopolyspora oryzae]
MNDRELASLRRCAERIRARVDRVLDDLGSAQAEVVRVLAPARRPLRRADVAQVHPTLVKVLDQHRGFVQGVGLALDDGHLDDASRWLEWWRSEDDEPARFVRHQLDPAHNHFYDYVGQDWFALPRRTGRPAVTGPFVDFAGTNEHTITLAVPVFHDDEFVDVLGADVAVEGVERLLIESLRSRSPDAVLLNEHDRVVASTSARWWSGTLLRRDAGVNWSQDIDLGGDLRWRLVAAHR